MHVCVHVLACISVYVIEVGDTPKQQVSLSKGQGADPVNRCRMHKKKKKIARDGI